ncbi:uncharacterized protein [Narcine bancroftii]|uniref:uncharacterized protein isoform X2 n=1 Tax=Narcine bancroftii TaxID=1343680 RepID=UPI00383191CF
MFRARGSGARGRQGLRPVTCPREAGGGAAVAARARGAAVEEEREEGRRTSWRSQRPASLSDLSLSSLPSPATLGVPRMHLFRLQSTLRAGSHNGFFDIHWHNSGPRVEKWQLQTPKVIKSLEPEHLGLEVTSPHAWHSLSGHMSKIKTMGAPCHLEADIRDLETTKRVLRDACLVNKGDDQRLQKLCPDQFKMATKIKENGVQIQNKTTLSDFGRNSAYLPRQNHGVKVGIFLRTELINWTVG